MCRSGGVANTTRAVVWNHAPICRSERVKRVEESSQVASFILWWFFVQRGGFLHSACAAVGMTKWGTFLVFIGNCSVLSGAERHIGRSLRFRWQVDVFNRGILRTCGFSVRGYAGQCFYGFDQCLRKITRCSALVFLSAVYYNFHRKEGIYGRPLSQEGSLFHKFYSYCETY